MKHCALAAVAACLLATQVYAKPPEFLNSGKVYPANVPLAEAVRVDGTLYLSGQIGIQPGTLKLVPGGIGPETRQAMEYVKEAFARHGVGMERVVKCTVFLADMKEWAAMNEVYVTYFPAGKPARSALGASGLALGARVEIECIAAL